MMAKAKKPAFPQTKDGVTDWERVFENPDDGLIPLISSAPSIEILHQCATLVIHKLFTRDNDKLEVARLTRQLDALINKGRGGEDIGALTQSIIDLLRQIKSDRIRFAREYLASSQKQRRAVPLGERLARSSYNLISHPKFTAVISGVIVVFFLIIFGALYLVFSRETASTNNAKPPPSSESAVTTPEVNDIPTAPAPALEEEPRQFSKMPPAIVLQRIFLPSPIGSKRTTAGMVLPVIILSSSRELDDVCNAIPIILDVLNAQFGIFQARGTDWSQADLMVIGQQVKKRLNDRAGGTIVERVKLIRSADRRDQGHIKCDLAPEKFLKYLN
jgi:hypothetical protein